MAARATAPKPEPVVGRSVLERLREPFPASQVKQRPGGGGKQLDYVAIETVLERLLDVAPEYSWRIQEYRIEPNATGSSYIATVSGQLSIGDKTAAGIGAMVNPDPDMALKSANSEAMKNAAKNGWGVSLELWDAGHREDLGRQRRLASGSEQALKNEVWRIAKERGATSLAAVAKTFNVKPGELADPATLQRILEQEGVL